MRLGSRLSGRWPHTCIHFSQEATMTKVAVIILHIVSTQTGGWNGLEMSSTGIFCQYHSTPFLISQGSSWPQMILVVWWRKLWMCVQTGTTLGSSSKWELQNWKASAHRPVPPKFSSEKCLTFGWGLVMILAGWLLLMLLGAEVLEQIDWLVLWSKNTAWWRKLKWTGVCLSLAAYLQLMSLHLQCLSQWYPPYNHGWLTWKEVSENVLDPEFVTS